MKGSQKVFVQFKTSLDKDWKHNLQSFKDSYKSIIGPQSAQAGFNVKQRKELYNKIDSMIAFMEDFSYNCFLLHLSPTEGKLFHKAMMANRTRVRKRWNLWIVNVDRNSDWRYEWCQQFFYDAVFYKITCIKNLSESKLNAIKNESSFAISQVINSYKIKYNKRTFRKLSTDYRIISKWLKRGLI